MRIVKVGQPGTLLRLLPADLPVDHDLSFSFLHWVDLSSMDLSLFNMTDVDIVDCDAHRTRLPDQIGGLTSRRTNWTGSVIPSTVSSAAHDLVAEAMRQNAGADPELQQLASIVSSYLSADYTRSWSDAFPHVRQQMGWAGTPAGSNMAKLRLVLQGYPSIAKRLTSMAKVDRWSTSPGGAHATDLAAVPVIGASWTLDLRPYQNLGTLDRWATARRLEQAIVSREPVVIYIKRMEPTIVLLAALPWAVTGQWWLNSNVADL